MNNETLSPKQAERILQEAGAAINRCIKDVVAKDDEFLDNLSRIWEDQNAVDFAKAHRETIKNILDNLKKNYNVFSDTLIEISRKYIQIGGMNITIQANASLLTLLPNISGIKVNFADGSAGEADAFGFLNPETGAEQVMDAFATLETSLKSIAVETTNSLRSINAFGNQDVRLAVASSAGKIVELLTDGIATTKQLVQEKVQATADSYKKTGASSTEVISSLINRDSGVGEAVSSGLDRTIPKF